MDILPALSTLGAGRADVSFWSIRSGAVAGRLAGAGSALRAACAAGCPVSRPVAGGSVVSGGGVTVSAGGVVGVMGAGVTGGGVGAVVSGAVTGAGTVSSVRLLQPATPAARAAPSNRAPCFAHGVHLEIPFIWQPAPAARPVLRLQFHAPGSPAGRNAAPVVRRRPRAALRPRPQPVPAKRREPAAPAMMPARVSPDPGDGQAGIAALVLPQFGRPASASTVVAPFSATTAFQRSAAVCAAPCGSCSILLRTPPVRRASSPAGGCQQHRCGKTEVLPIDCFVQQVRFTAWMNRTHGSGVEHRWGWY